MKPTDLDTLLNLLQLFVSSSMTKIVCSKKKSKPVPPFIVGQPLYISKPEFWTVVTTYITFQTHTKRKSFLIIITLIRLMSLYDETLEKNIEENLEPYY